MAGVPKLTERDCLVLESLYRLNIMNMKQIHEAHFSDVSIQFARRRIRKLIERGYIKKDKNNYLATLKGATEVTTVTSKPSQLLNKKNRLHFLQLSEIYTSLNNTNWEFIPSRYVKSSYALNRNTYLDGELNNKATGKKYIIYLLNKNPHLTTIEKIKSEIKKLSEANKHNQIQNDFIIFVQSGAALKEFSDGQLFGTNSLHVLPYLWGLKVLKIASETNWLLKLIEKEIQLQEIQAINILTNFFAEYIITDNSGEKYYLTELITHDISKKYYLEQYNQERYEEKRIKVLLVCAKSQYKKFSEEFTNPFIKIIGIKI